jgi:septal ring factor EnvC (AmiA/AmiB activator)
MSASSDNTSGSTSGTDEGISNPNGHEAKIERYEAEIRDFKAENTGYMKKIEGYEEEIKGNKKKISIIETNLGGSGGGTSGDQEEIKRLEGVNQTLGNQIAAVGNQIAAVGNQIAETLKSINLLREQQGRQGEIFFDVLLTAPF